MSAAALGKMFCQDIHSRALIFLIYFSSDLNVFLSFLPFTMNFSHPSKSVRQPAGCCCVYEQIENVQGGQNRGINPEHRLQLKPTTQHLTMEGEKKCCASNYNNPMGFFFLFSVHICSMPNKSLESLELAHADKTAIKGVVNTREERGEKQNKKKLHTDM